MKKLLCLSLMFLLFPILVSASTVYVNSNSKPGDVFFKDSILSIYKEHNGTTEYNVYLDNKSVNDDITLDGSYYKYTIPKDVVIKTVNYSRPVSGATQSLYLTVYFESINLAENKVHCYIEGKEPSEITNPYYYFDKKYCDDYIEEGKYYSSNEILLIYRTLSNVSYYNTEGDIIDHYRAQSEFFPKMGDDVTYWAFTGTDNSGYKGFVSPVFEEYIPPKFELKCNPKTIKYNEKSTCTLYGTVDLNLKNVNFDFDPKEYKVLSSKFPDGIENKSGDKQYNLVIDEDYKQTEAGFVLGVFEITGKENKQYTDDVQIINLDYVDAKVKAKYANLEDPIEIVALADSTKEIKALKEEKNPDTSSSLSIIIPTVLFVVTLIAFFVVDRKKKIKNIS